MRNLHRLAPAILLLAACASKAPAPAANAAQPPSPTPAVVQPAEEPAATRPIRPGMVPIAARGLTCRSAIVLDATTEAAAALKENAWITENYPGAVKVATTAITCNDKPAQQIDLETANGRKVSLFFDISAWAVKPH